MNTMAGLVLQDVTIADHAAACVETFTKCLLCDVQLIRKNEWTEEQQTRFMIWAANLGVFARGHASADYRLRDVDEIRNLMVQLLEALCENLIYTLKNSTSEDRNSDLGSETPQDQSPTLSTSSFTFSSISSSNAVGEESISAFVLEARTEVEDAISRLNRLSASIRNSGTPSRDLRAATFIDRDEEGNDLTAFYGRLSTLVVNQQFPNADEYFRQRVADSLARRRNQLSYRRKHQQKLTQRYVDNRPFNTASEQKSKMPLDTFISNPQDKDIAIEEPNTQQTKFSNTSASQFEPNLFGNRPRSATSEPLSTTMIGTPSQVAKLNFPREPQVNRTDVFECPYCFILCPAKEARGNYWKNHVMRDLAPYICTFEDCDKSQDHFQTFPDWIAHIRNEHKPLHWDCLAPVHGPQSFDSQELYIEHMQLDHRGTFADSQLSTLAQMSARAEYRVFSICPFCNNLPKDLTNNSPNEKIQENQEYLQKHIAQHLQSIALISLRWLDDSKSNSTSQRDSCLAPEDQTEGLTFQDPPDRPLSDDSDLDSEFNEIWYSWGNISNDKIWATSRLSQMVSSEWGFITDSQLSTYPDPADDEVLAPFLKTYLQSQAVSSSSADTTLMARLHYDRSPGDFRGDFLEVHRVCCRESGTVVVYEDIPKYSKSNCHLQGSFIFDDSYEGLKTMNDFEWGFLVYHDYICECDVMASSSSCSDLRDTPTTRDALQILSQSLCDVINNMDNNHKRLPFFHIGLEIRSPYIPFYHNRIYIESHRQLMAEKLPILDILLGYIYATVRVEYELVDRLFSDGLTNAKSIPFLFSPMGLIVYPGEKGQCEAFRQTMEMVKRSSCMSNNHKDSHGLLIWEITVESSLFCGPFFRKSSILTLKYDDDDQIIKITDLAFYPLRFANRFAVKYLIAQGIKSQVLWSLVGARLISYSGWDQAGREFYTESRCMLDMQTYSKIHGKEISVHEVADVSADEDLLLLPTHIFGFCMKYKKWINLKIDSITEIIWQSECFRDLVIEHNHKDIIVALLKDALNADALSQTTSDIVRDNCKGLVMYLHGQITENGRPQGTGKTTTTEYMAEYLRKPLYRITSEEIGSDPKNMENILDDIFKLERVWNFVLLLDDADIFLPNHVPKIPNQDALIATFVRMVQYYSGILVLTTNGAGNFDQIFKSRIYVCLYFQQRMVPKRRKLWEILLQLTFKTGDCNELDLTEHLDELAAFPMNGAEIKSTIMEARIVSNSLNQILDFSHIKSVLGEGSGFALVSSSPAEVIETTSRSSSLVGSMSDKDQNKNKRDSRVVTRPGMVTDTKIIKYNDPDTTSSGRAGGNWASSRQSGSGSIAQQSTVYLWKCCYCLANGMLYKGRADTCVHCGHRRDSTCVVTALKSRGYRN